MLGPPPQESPHCHHTHAQLKLNKDDCSGNRTQATKNRQEYGIIKIHNNMCFGPVIGLDKKYVKIEVKDVTI